MTVKTLGILVVDHGSRRAASNEQLKMLASRIGELLPRATVRHAHMEIATPTIREGVDGLAVAGCEDLVVLLCFFAAGKHVSEDVPSLVSEAAARHQGLQWRIGEPIGPHEDLARLLLKRGGLEPEPER